MKICKWCKKEYDEKQVKRIYGETSRPYEEGYCSAACYTQAAMDKNKENNK